MRDQIWQDMVLIDGKILFGGLAMLAVGIGMLALLGYIMPTGVPGMTDEEAFDLIVSQQENRDLSTLAGILAGAGFLLVLISLNFGARRKSGSGAKKVEKKPVT